jgi:Zn-dependent peptidase ImmA (M78 family)
MTRLTTSEQGDTLELRIRELFQREIDADRFWAKKENCKVYWKKGYYSKDRDRKIVFDVSVEVFLPGAKEFSALVLIECKNYSHPVPVDDVEEFFTKVQQVAAANAKAVIVSTASFQSGTRSFAKSKGIGLMRYFDSENFKWELKRSPSASAKSTSADDAYQVEVGLSDDNFTSRFFDLYLQSPLRETNSLWDFFEDLILDSALTSAQAKKVTNSRRKLVSQVPFYGKRELEERSAEILGGLNYGGGELNLSALCAREAARTQLVVQTGVLPPDVDTVVTNPALGRITFDPLVIQVYAYESPNGRRDRFTLAHELSHHLLDHGRHMVRESCDEGDFVVQRHFVIDGNDISRMEFQANYLAASLLMPLTHIFEDFRRIVQTLGIANRGFGALYVDAQPCNLRNLNAVMGRLMRRYGVSRTAVKIRLESLGLLCDVRAKGDPSSIQQIFAQSLGR